MHDIIISEFMDQAAVDLLARDFKTHYDPDLVDKPEELAKLAASARSLIVRNRTQVRGALLEGAGSLECVGRLGVGLDNIDVDACKARGVAVFPATGANDLSVAEYVIATAMMLLRRAYLSTDRVIAGEWPRNALIGGELSGRVMGLVGFGAIAREVARRAGALGMPVIAFDPFLPADHAAWKGVGNRSLDALLTEADVVSLHTPLTTETRHMIDGKVLELMKDSAVLINAARGGVVDEDALCAALKAGKLAGAALDVFEKEPLDAESGRRFAGIGNLVLTPHIAGVTEESNVRVSRVTAEAVLKHLRGNS
ncbi:D-3-phosphoglycerate dehydrogenase [Nitratireductor indicus C115]|uniref:D-3-phosphoglycerate dehydrogenase n=1 Tax=Nitratireductor indicus C115 TaxID=1231190 RepID=K2NQ82_9HYPH|nr:hydroxyacid dehydrogenase [Nitratireductor indicus]EKF41510.1 D-3-phosphoglycerate dehydrogenase [Nitratireductor indicus C115]SFQ69596.1 (S)-sulfolactate dehydrogenase [Nitratireductor indicus]